MAAAVLLHALLGVALAAVVWLAGAGVARGRLRHAYAAGLVLLVAAAFVSLLSVALLPVAVVALAAAAWIGARAVDQFAIARARASLLAALPGALGFALALGLFQRGPNETRGSNAFGDLVFYVAEVTSAAQSVVPFRDLALDGNEHPYVQSAPAFVGGALERLPGFDPFLFFAATLPAFVFAALAIGLGVVDARGPALAGGLLVAGSFAYPTWVSESPPIALAAPVVFSFSSFVLEAAALVLTKGIGLVSLVAYTAVDGARRPRALVALGGVVIAAVVAAASARWLTELITFEFLPADAVRLDARSTTELAPAVLVVAHLFLVAAAVRLRRAPVLAAVVAAVAAAWFVGGHGPDAAVALAVLLVALEARRADALLLAAAACLVVAAWFREIAGLGTGAVLLALAILAALGAFVRARMIVLATASLVVVAAGALLGFLRLDPASPPLTSAHYELWTNVERLVPRNALVFTSLTGEKIELDQGWNYAGAISGRQHYVAGWANSPLRVEDDDREERLRRNARALGGDFSGIDVGDRPLFLVLRVDERPPAQARRAYANERFALYAMP